MFTAAEGMALRAKGAISELKAATWYLSEGYQVFFPVCDGGVVDFIAYKPGKTPELVQVKTAHWIESSGNRYLQLRVGRTKGTRRGPITRDWDPTNPEDHYDYLIGVFEDRMWKIPKAEFPEGKKTIYLEKTGRRPSKVDYDPGSWLVKV